MVRNLRIPKSPPQYLPKWTQPRSSTDIIPPLSRQRRPILRRRSRSPWLGPRLRHSPYVRYGRCRRLHLLEKMCRWTIRTNSIGRGRSDESAFLYSIPSHCAFGDCRGGGAVTGCDCVGVEMGTCEVGETETVYVATVIREGWICFVGE